MRKKSVFAIYRKKKAQCVHFPNFLSRLCTIAPKLFLIGVFSGHYSFLLICTDPKVGFRGARMDIYQAHQTKNSGNWIRANSTENDHDLEKIELDLAGPPYSRRPCGFKHPWSKFVFIKFNEWRLTFLF